VFEGLDGKKQLLSSRPQAALYSLPAVRLKGAWSMRPRLNNEKEEEIVCPLFARLMNLDFDR